jgi:hypothetical protein
LAARATLGLSTVVDFEKNRRTVAPDSIAALQAALESAGAVFVENGAGFGVKIRR